MEGISSKIELRTFFLNRRLDLSESEVKEKSEHIIQWVIHSDEFKNAGVVHTYIPIRKKKEVDTFSLINECFAREKKVIVPKIAGDGVLKHFELSSFEELKTNEWGVPEPPDKEEFPVDEIDLVIVPMVAGDPFKNRLGYGNGFYDRFLSKTNAPTFGLLYGCQLLDDKLPVESFDIPLDILVTESQTIK